MRSSGAEPCRALCSATPCVPAAGLPLRCTEPAPVAHRTNGFPRGTRLGRDKRRCRRAPLRLLPRPSLSALRHAAPAARHGARFPFGRTTARVLSMIANCVRTRSILGRFAAASGAVTPRQSISVICTLCNRRCEMPGGWWQIRRSFRSSCSEARPKSRQRLGTHLPRHR
jgi:hypothetical protein